MMGVTPVAHFCRPSTKFEPPSKEAKKKKKKKKQKHLNVGEGRTEEHQSFQRQWGL